MREPGKRQPRSPGDRWPGGYIRRGKKRATYVIDRSVDGRHFHVSTRASDIRAALEQLRRFEANPAGYEPAGEEARAEVTLTEELVDQYADWMRNTKRNTEEWVCDVVRYLGDWAEDLGGKDLRDVSVQRDLHPALDERQTSRKHRVEAIKAFYGWLRRQRGLLKHAEDPTLDMPVPQGAAAKLTRKRVVETGRIRAVLRWLPAAVRDVLILQSGTAWHISEVRRFAQHGEILRPFDRSSLAVITTQHKSREPHATALNHPEHLAAAERIRKRGYIPSRSTISHTVNDACDAARVPRFGLGQMRHTVLSNAVKRGATVEQASRFAGHASVETTKKFYLDMAVPAAPVPALRLVKR